ncbi:MAG: alpha/beta fold hydrolase [bacterium]
MVRVRDASLGTSPFFLEGGPDGCLLIHGFTGSPAEMRPLGDYLAARGVTVSGIQLRGHGTTPAEMSATGWRDWADSAIDGFNDLKKRCDRVYVAGFSMGGALALYLGAAREDVCGVASLSGAALIRDWRLSLLPLMRRFIRYFPKGGSSDLTDRRALELMVSYDRIPLSCVEELLEFTGVVRDLLPHVKAPLLVMHGLKDRSLRPSNAQYIYDRAGSEEKEIVLLDNSGHGIVVDVQKEVVFEKVHGLIARSSPDAGARKPPACAGGRRPHRQAQTGQTPRGGNDEP